MAGHRLANGKVFSNVFNYPANYWNGASLVVNHLLDLNGGDIKGKKVHLVYHNSAMAKSQSGLLKNSQKSMVSN